MPTNFVKLVKEQLENKEYASILALAKNNEIDVYAPLFYESNLFEYAALEGHLVLLEQLYEENLIDVNNTAEPLLCTLVRAYEPDIHDPIFDFLLTKTNIQLSAKNEFGYTAACWAERTQNYPLMVKLMACEQGNSLAHKVYHTKMTCLKFGLKNPANSQVFKISNIEHQMEPEGGKVELTVPDLIASFDQFQNEINDVIIDEQKQIYSAVNQSLKQFSLYKLPSREKLNHLCENIADAHQKGEMISLHAVESDHATSMVICGDIVYNCNKGFGKHPKYVIVKNQLPCNTKFDANDISTFLVTNRPELNTRFLQGIEGKPQHVGNCTATSPKKAIQAMIYHKTTEYYQNLSSDEQKVMARQLYKRWSQWDKEQQLNKLATTCRDEPELLTQLLNNVLCLSFRSSKSNGMLLNKLYQLIETTIIKEQLKNIDVNSLFSTVFTHLLSIDASKNVDQFVNKLLKRFNLFSQECGIKKLNKPLSNQWGLIIATIKGNHEQLIKLLNNDAKEPYHLVVPHSRRLSCLHLAAICGRTDCLKTLLDYYPELINSVDENNFSPLHMAIYYRRDELIQPLLDKGADKSLQAGKMMQLSLDMLLQVSPETEPAILISTEKIRDKLENHHLKKLSTVNRL